MSHPEPTNPAALARWPAEPPAGAGALTTTSERLRAWLRGAGMQPVHLALACCAVEMTAVHGPHAPWGEPPPAVLPAASDLLIVAGTVSEKLAPWLRQLWDEMPRPKWSMAVGSCAACGGPFPTYAVAQGVDRIIPIDVYVPGCPPSPEALLAGFQQLEKRIDRWRGSRGLRGQV
jgi:NADH-quinone oxidoreductase subunit B